MVELLIAMLIGSVLAVSVVTVFIHQTRAMALNEDLVDLEQNLRVAMDMLHRDVRMAGAFSKDNFPAFVIGGIDTDGNGTLDKNSEGGPGVPDAMQVRFSDTPGLEIVFIGGTELRVCAPSGIVEDQIIPVVNSDGSLSKEFEVKNPVVTVSSCPSCPASLCDKINYDPPPLGGTYSGGVVLDQMNTLTYFIEPDYVLDGNSLGPALMQKQGLGPLPVPHVVAFGVDDLQIVYKDSAGSPTTTLADIRLVEVEVSGETHSEHSLSGPKSKRSRLMTTEILVRNLTF